MAEMMAEETEQVALPERIHDYSTSPQIPRY